MKKAKTNDCNLLEYVLSLTNYGELEIHAYRKRYYFTSSELARIINHMYEVLIQNFEEEDLWDPDAIARPMRPGMYGLVCQENVSLKDLNHDLLLTMLCTVGEGLGISAMQKNLLDKFVLCNEFGLLFDLANSLTVACFEKLFAYSKDERLLYLYFKLIIARCLPLQKQLYFIDNVEDCAAFSLFESQVEKKRGLVKALFIFLKRKQLPFLSKDVWINILKMVLYGPCMNDEIREKLKSIEDQMKQKTKNST